MMLGIFAKIFARPTLAETLDAVAAHDLTSIQFNLESAGSGSMPESVDDETIAAIRDETARRGITISSLSGTFNMIHPDPTVVRDGLRRFESVAKAARPMGADFVTLCTGTRDPDNMWRRHPDNDSPAAWADLIQTTDSALEIAARCQVTLGVEPEPGNVINSARKCRRLIDHFGSNSLKVIFDPANLISTNLARDPVELLEEAFNLLGPDIAIGHGKDCGPLGEIVPAGEGIVPWRLVIDCLTALGGGADIPLIVHGIGEGDVARTLAFLRGQNGSAP